MCSEMAAELPDHSRLATQRGAMVDARKPLRRSRTDRMIAGVVAGLADYFGMDVTLARVIFVVVSIVSVAFPGMIVYLLMWLLIPEEGP